MHRSIGIALSRFVGVALVAASTLTGDARALSQERAATPAAQGAPESPKRGESTPQAGSQPAKPAQDGKPAPESKTGPEGKTKEAPKQEPDPHEAPEELPLPKLAGADEAKQEMIELFHQVESKLAEIDKLLYDAGAGEALGDGVKDAGIDRLLRDAQQRSAAAQQGIDRILELARQQRQQQQSSSSGGGQSQQQGPSPLDQQQSGDPQQREKRPEGQAPEQQQPHGEDPQGQQPQSPKDSSGDPSQRQSALPPAGAVGSASHAADDRERWGELPEQVRDVFRVQGGGDLPPRYRDFIDSYYRRMSKRP